MDGIIRLANSIKEARLAISCGVSVLSTKMTYRIPMPMATVKTDSMTIRGV
ncbi:hypothetical protein D3C75_1073400 [compost metagenome]